MSTASEQDPPRVKDGWIKWAKALKQKEWNCSSTRRRELHGIINNVLWDKRTKTVDITQQQPYLAILAHLDDDRLAKLYPPSGFNCEATRIMNGGQLPTIIRDRLQEAGWDPDLCTSAYSWISRRLKQTPSSNTNDDIGSMESFDLQILPDVPSRQDQQHIAEDSKMTQTHQSTVNDEPRNQLVGDQPATQPNAGQFLRRHLKLARKKKRSRRDKDSAPKELTPWMEWAKRQQNPAFADAPEREELEDTLEAVSWHSNGHPMPYKNQQPFIHLRGRWGPEGERQEDEVPSVINLEATRIMNKRKLPRELCEWLANVGWDAKKCCNPKLSVLEKKLSVDPQTIAHQPEPATSESGEESHQNNSEHIEAPKLGSYSSHRKPIPVTRTYETFTRGQACMVPPMSSMFQAANETRRWKSWARGRRKMVFTQYPDEDARLKSNIDKVIWNARKSRPMNIHTQAPYISLMAQCQDRRIISDGVVPSAADCEAVCLMHKLKFPTNLKNILANAGWDAIKCCDPSLPVDQRRLRPRLEESFKHHLAEALAESAPSPKRQKLDMPNSELSDDKTLQTPIPIPKWAPENIISEGNRFSDDFDLSLFPRLSNIFRDQESTRLSPSSSTTSNSQINVTHSPDQSSRNPKSFNNSAEPSETVQTPKETSTTQTAIMPSTPSRSKSTAADKFGSAFLNDQMAKMADIGAAFARHAQERDNAHNQQKDDLRRAIDAVEKSSQHLRQARKDLDSAHNQHDLDIAMLKKLISPDEDQEKPV
ncbi:hypothetical protein CKAH01_04944 [Colletotrichum kahawae]|uniref:Uncharacterized protein n=1 Tax=Colletotrichum kahawae TaxID=34407 RepID=A0AAE0D7V5_COLKA|nr:hypothetical protein CKAH01_04944 [Colletotrichum kahawae]